MAKAKKKETKGKMTRAQLIETAKELNKLGFDPELHTDSKTKVATLEKELREAGKQLTIDDTLSDKATVVLMALGCDLSVIDKKEKTAVKAAIKALKTQAKTAEKKTSDAKATKKKAAAKTAKTEKKPAKKAETKKDEFGFTIGSQNHKFAMAIKKKPMNMATIKGLPWNMAKTTFYNLFNKMVKDDQAYKEGNMMHIK